jgi:hypothetical protein
MAQVHGSDPVLAGIAPGTSPAQMPDDARAALGRAFAQFRAETRADSDAAVVAELRAIIAGS